MNAHWEQRPPPDIAPGASWRGAPSTAAELTTLRGQLHTALRDGPLTLGADADAVETVLLAFEELASNGLRHGRPPVHVTVTATGAGWLLEVSDAAGDRPPTPAVGRDPAHGGLGLHLVARLCPAHGWIPRNGRKHVWAHVAPAADADTAADADAG
jgi:anti-sigma regulatory factor (Ser/Thr protein kinase)